MRAAWRLATSSLSGRRLRTGLLAMAVGLAGAFIVGVACAVSSVNAGLTARIVATIGAADASVKHIGGRPLDASALDLARSWPEVALVAPQRYGSLPLINPANGKKALAFGTGVDPAAEAQLRAPQLVEGRPAVSLGEVVVQPRVAETLGAGMGDTIEVERFGDPVRLRIVGVAAPPPFAAMLQRPLAQVTLETLELAAGEPGRLDELPLVLRPGVTAQDLVDRRSGELPEGVVIEPSARITSGLDKNLRSSNIALTIVSIFAFLGAGFIILTGLTTSVAERQRELAIVRCLGGSRMQIGGAQILVGMFIGGVGALFGLPLGLGLAWLGAVFFPEHFPAGLVVNPVGVVMSVAGSIGAGLLGSAWPAWRASRASPLEAMAVRARVTPTRAVVVAGLLGAGLAAVQLSIMLNVDNAQLKYWSYVTLGAPLLFLGYFLLASGVTTLVGRALARPVAALLRVPGTLLADSVGASPFRNGFTAGSLMAGLALMTALWTQGTALMRDWLGAIRFPDAFVHGLTGLTEEDRRAIAALPAVRDTCAVGMLRIDAASFGVQAIRPVGTAFVGFEPEAFFRMSTLEWVEGDQSTAVERLKAGGAVLVSREFRVAKGLGVGDRFPISWKGREIEFEIVGVVGSPGLEIASKFFDISSEYREQSLHAVLGTRKDLSEKFGNDAIKLVQMTLAPDVGDEEALAQVRQALRGKLVVAGSGREIMAGIDQIGGRAMRAMSTVAVVAMLIACFGVGNIVVAGIDARRHEFGVLRAVGGSGALLARLVIAETLLIALGACVLGAALGVQASFNGLQLYKALAGLELRLRPPVLPILAGWGILITLTLGAAAPAALALARRKPRELLGATRG